MLNYICCPSAKKQFMQESAGPNAANYFTHRLHPLTITNLHLPSASHLVHIHLPNLHPPLLHITSVTLNPFCFSNNSNRDRWQTLFRCPRCCTSISDAAVDWNRRNLKPTGQISRNVLPDCSSCIYLLLHVAFVEKQSELTWLPQTSSLLDLTNRLVWLTLGVVACLMGALALQTIITLTHADAAHNTQAFLPLSSSRGT